jgi:hypothetical protein
MASMLAGDDAFATAKALYDKRLASAALFSLPTTPAKELEAWNTALQQLAGQLRASVSPSTEAAARFLFAYAEIRDRKVPAACMCCWRDGGKIIESHAVSNGLYGVIGDHYYDADKRALVVRSNITKAAYCKSYPAAQAVAAGTPPPPPSCEDMFSQGGENATPALLKTWLNSADGAGAPPVLNPPTPVSGVMYGPELYHCIAGVVLRLLVQERPQSADIPLAQLAYTRLYLALRAFLLGLHGMQGSARVYLLLSPTAFPNVLAPDGEPMIDDNFTIVTAPDGTAHALVHFWLRGLHFLVTAAPAALISPAALGAGEASRRLV